MKFTTTVIALAGALATATTAESKSQLRLDMDMRHRQLEAAANNYNYGNGNGANGYDAAADNGGSSTLSFLRCYEMTVDGYQSYGAIKSQTAKPVVSSATFSINQDVNSVMTMRLGDYVTAMIQNLNAVTYNEKDCERCLDIKSYCETQEDAGSCYYLSQIYCLTNGCLQQNANYGCDGEIAEFLEEIAECLPVEYDGTEYYIGFACGSSGDVAEFAAFLDNECIVQTTSVSATFLFSIAARDEDQDECTTNALYTDSIDYLVAAFTTPISCYDNDSCTQMIENAAYVSECAAEDEDEQGEAEYQVEDQDYSWYPEVQVEDKDDDDEVCAATYKQFLANQDDITYVYDETKQGSIFDVFWPNFSWDRESGTWYKNKNLNMNMNSQMSAGMISLIALGAILAGTVVFVSVAAATKTIKKNKNQANAPYEEPLYQLS